MRSASQTNFRNRSIALAARRPIRSHLLRRQAGDRSVHPAVLAERQRTGSGRDGRDAGGRRRQSDHQGARGRRRPYATTRWP